MSWFLFLLIWIYQIFLSKRKKMKIPKVPHVSPRKAVIYVLQNIMFKICHTPHTPTLPREILTLDRQSIKLKSPLLKEETFRVLERIWPGYPNHTVLNQIGLVISMFLIVLCKSASSEHVWYYYIPLLYSSLYPQPLSRQWEVVSQALSCQVSQWLTSSRMLWIIDNITL